MKEQTKTCIHCWELKPVSNFNKCKKSKDHFQSTCKDCTKQYMKVWYASNILKVKQYYRDHSEIMKATHKAWRAAHPEKIKQYNNAVLSKDPFYWKKYQKLNAKRIERNYKRWKKNKTENEK